MKLVPLGENIVVKRLEAEDRSAGGILLPEGAREKPRQGRVLAVGDGRPMPDGGRASLQIGEGDRVLFSPHAGSEFQVNGEPLLILRESDVLAVVE